MACRKKIVVDSYFKFDSPVFPKVAGVFSFEFLLTISVAPGIGLKTIRIQKSWIKFTYNSSINRLSMAIHNENYAVIIILSEGAGGFVYRYTNLVRVKTMTRFSCLYYHNFQSDCSVHNNLITISSIFFIYIINILASAVVATRRCSYSTFNHFTGWPGFDSWWTHNQHPCL